MNKVLKKAIETLSEQLRFIASNLSGEESRPIQVQTKLEKQLAYNTEHATELALALGFDLANSTIQYQKAQHH
jgi:hypothetical protein